VAGLLRSRSRRLLGSLLSPHRRSVLLAAALIALWTVSGLAGPWLIQQGIDKGIPPLLDGGSGSPRTLITIVLLYAATSIVAAVSLNGFVVVIGRVGQDVLLDLRARLFDHFQRLSLAFHERYTSGRVISRLTSDIEAVAELFYMGVIALITALVVIGGIAVILLILDWQLALVALLVFPLVLVLTVWFRIHSEQAYRATREAIALVIVHFTESLGGIRAVQAFRREPRNQEIMEDVNDQYRDANVWSMNLAAVYGPGVQSLGRLTTALVLLYGGTRVANGQMTLGVLAAFLLYLRRFFEPLQDLSQFYNLFQAASAALEKLSGVLQEEPAVAEPERPVALPHASGALQFEGVTFAYRRDPVLHEVDLSVPAGQTVALVGETGAGKSTIARLVARFYDPTAGRILLDGVDLRELGDADLRRAVVMVTQENFLFSGTVADNIAFGRPSASRDEIVAAARAIGADGFLAALPNGYDTDVRKRGGRLSAGQRQLVAFARAFLADPAVLILDEATSSLDIPSERQVQRALQTLLADRTALIIAHRLTTVEIADRVLVVDGGRIVEDGQPADLIAGGGRYAGLHRAWLESLV
jgi:ABC-type multidrug transport system fused ATPase/permease subunit